MNIESISAVSSMSMVSLVDTGFVSNGHNFESWIADGLSELNESAQRADEIVASAAEAPLDNLHQMVYELEKISKSFELAVLVRDKALEAYQEVLRMQV